MSSNELAPNQVQRMILAAFRKIMRPFVRLFLEKNITYTLLLEELKRVFVEVADSEFRIAGKAQTDSRITLLTGVHRRDVHRIRLEAEDEPLPKNNFSAQLIAQWLGNTQYLDSTGKPKRLSRTARTGAEDSFEALVASVSKDIRSRPVLDEWLRTNIVHQTEDGYIELNTEAFIPEEDLEEKLFFLRMNVHDHLAATINNTLNQKKMFERCVYYDNLDASQLAQIEALVHQFGMDYLKVINQKAASLSTQTPANPNTPQYRMNTGVYFFYEPIAEKHPDENA